MTNFHETAPAKVNLTLDVLGRRTDGPFAGYHEITSLVVFARDVADEVILETSKPVGSSVSGPFGHTIAGRNVIDLTLAKLAGAVPGLQLGAIHLIKNLPVAAGIGGGSADAAAVLRAVRRTNPDHAASVDWFAIARSIGADVPVCFDNSAAWMTGIGDEVQALQNVPCLNAVLVNPLQAMPADKTAQVFRALNAPGLRVHSTPPAPDPFPSASMLVEYMTHHGNALDVAACSVAPIIADIKNALLSTEGCQYAAVSGGGPTCFGIFADNAVAAASLARQHPTWWVRAATLG